MGAKKVDCLSVLIHRDMQTFDLSNHSSGFVSLAFYHSFFTIADSWVICSLAPPPRAFICLLSVSLLPPVHVCSLAEIAHEVAFKPQLRGSHSHHFFAKQMPAVQIYVFYILS
jgi:hypothetical protein